jgi:hypothetical protein
MAVISFIGLALTVAMWQYTVVEHLPHYPKVKGLNLATTTDREYVEKIPAVGELETNQITKTY